MKKHLSPACLSITLFFMTASAYADDFDTLRTQATIATAYDFSPLPKNAGHGISMAILTTGVNPDIQKMLGSRFRSENLLTTESDADQDGVGTFSVSLAAALAPGGGIISIKVLDHTGLGSAENIARGIERATALGAKVIVLTIGGDPGSRNDGITKAVTAAVNAGCLVVASAGNEAGSQPGYPADVDGVVAVGATDAEDKLSAYSNYGGKIIYAPGDDVSSLDEDGKPTTQSGTSSAVVVAGAIYAVLWSEKPKASARDIMTVVQQSARSIDAHGARAKRIDAAAALRAISK